jgi:hypothetical protein
MLRVVRKVLGRSTPTSTTSPRRGDQSASAGRLPRRLQRRALRAAGGAPEQGRRGAGWWSDTARETGRRAGRGFPADDLIIAARDHGRAAARVAATCSTICRTIAEALALHFILDYTVEEIAARRRYRPTSGACASASALRAG